MSTLFLKLTQGNKSSLLELIYTVCYPVEKLTSPGLLLIEMNKGCMLTATDLLCVFCFMANIEFAIGLVRGVT